MRAYFSAQPWLRGRNVGDFLTDVTVEPTADSRLRIAVAWTSASGVALAAPHFEKVIAVGGSVDLITGLSSGGATRQGLERALEVCSSVHVVFDVSGPTFHPKIYLSRNGLLNNLLVGSNNLTAGGYFRNIEAGVTVEALTTEDVSIFDEVDEWLDELIADTSLVLPLTTDLIAKLVADPRYKIGDEDERRVASGGSAEPVPANGGLFSKSVRVRKSLSRPKWRVVGERIIEEAVEGLVPSVTLPPEPASVLRVWSKALSDSDALRPTNPNTKVTGVLRLGKSVFPIDKNTFFLNEFFGSLDWAANEGKLETVVPFDTTINGASRGVQTLKVDFFESRIADQNNIPTVLHWGTLSHTLRSGDYRAHWVVLREMSDGAYQLEIKPTPDIEDLPETD